MARQSGDRIEDLDRSLGRREQRRAGDEGVAAEVRHDRVTALLRVFHRERGAEARTEGSRVGQEVGGAAVRARDAEPVQVVRVEVEERRGATGRDAGELDEGLVEVDLVLCLAEEVEARGRLGLTAANRRAREEVAGAASDLQTDEGAERAIGGLRASIELQAAERTEARVVLAELPRRRDVVFEPRTARDAQASVRARDVEEPGAVGRADTNVFHRRSLPHGKVGACAPATAARPAADPRRRLLTSFILTSKVSR